MIIRRIANRIGRLFGKRQAISMLADVYPEYPIGRGSYGDLTVHSYGDDTRFSMGAYCSVAEGCTVILGGGHRTDWVTTYPFSATETTLEHIPGHPVTRGDVRIGSDVWLATGVTVLSGVTIGHGAVAMAGAVITRDVAPYAMVAGVPACEIGKRFDDTVIARLLALEWWNWQHDRIVAAGPHLLSGDVTGFLDLAETGKI